MPPADPQIPKWHFNDQKVVNIENAEDIKKEKLHDRKSYLPVRVLQVTSLHFLNKSWSNLAVTGS